MFVQDSRMSRKGERVINSLLGDKCKKYELYETCCLWYAFNASLSDNVHDY